MLTGAVLTGALAAGCVEYEPRGRPVVADPVPDRVHDVFVQPRREAVDVLVFADTSDSMAEELATLGQTVTPFVERLAATVPDWQLAAVTGEGGCAVGGVITPAAADFAARFAEAVVTPTTAPTFQEMGLLAVARAVEEAAPGGCNAGLVRGDLLLVVLVSDEADQSPGFDDAGDYWAEYLDRIVDAHGNPLGVVVSAVAGPVPGGCVTEARRAEPGEGYDRVSAATGGLFLSICDDWAGELGALVAGVDTPRDRFVLSEVPVASTLEVQVDGAPASGWSYAAASGAIVFRAPPGPGQQIDVSYVPAR